MVAKRGRRVLCLTALAVVGLCAGNSEGFGRRHGDVGVLADAAVAPDQHEFQDNQARTEVATVAREPSLTEAAATAQERWLLASDAAAVARAAAIAAAVAPLVSSSAFTVQIAARCKGCSGGTSGQCQNKTTSLCSERVMGHCYFSTRDCGYVGHDDDDDKPPDSRLQTRSQGTVRCKGCSDSTSGQCQNIATSVCYERPRAGECYFGDQDCRGAENRRQQSANYSTPWLQDPAKWRAFSEEVRQRGDFDDLKHYFDCSHVANTRQPIHSEGVWRALRAKYAEIVGKQTNTTITPSDDDGFLVDIVVEHSKTKGRTVVAGQPIRKGDRVYDDERQAALFTRHQAFREFVFQVPIPCDVMMWSYPSVPAVGAFVADGLLINLNPTSYLNDGGVGLANMNNGVATRNISRGEELLEDYAESDIDPATGEEWQAVYQLQ